MSMLRRRVYRKDGATIKESYGYFLPLFSILTGNYVRRQENNLHKFPTNVYTKALQQEDPVGTFPNAYRRECSGTDPLKAFLSGYTDGTSILEATATHLYFSTDAGRTWTIVDGGTFPTITTWWWWKFTPIVWFDSNYYYMLYATNDDINEGSAHFYIYKVVRSTNSGGSTYLWSDSSKKFWNYFGFGSNAAVSNLGLIMIGLEDGKKFRIFDFKYLKFATTYATMEDNGSNHHSEGAGQWLNNNTTYGLWVVSCAYTISGCKLYYINAAAVTYNNTSSTYSWTEFSGPYELAYGTKVGIWIDTCRTSGQGGKLFAIGGETRDNYHAFTGTIPSGGGIGSTGTGGSVGSGSYGSSGGVVWTETSQSVAEIAMGISENYNYVPSLVMVSPDNKYGIALCVGYAMVFDINTGNLVSAYTLKDLEGYKDYCFYSSYFGYLYPRRTLTVS